MRAGIWDGIEGALENGAMVIVIERSVRVRRFPVFRD
jgi:hypothetical protein